MYIVILGSGQVAASLVSYFANEGYDITVLDQDELAIKSLQLHFDIRGIIGHPCDPEFLKKADIARANIMISVTLSDEINMLSCLLAHKIFATPMRIACVRNAHYSVNPKFSIEHDLAVNIAFNPEQEVAQHIYDLTLNPGVIEKFSFCQDAFLLILIEVAEGMRIASQKVKDLNDLMPNVYFVFSGLYKREESLLFDENLEISVDDEIYFFLKKEDLNIFLSELKGQSVGFGNRNIAVVGGGEIGLALSQKLEKTCNVKLIENDPARAELDAKILDHTMVLIGDATDYELLEEESINSADIFIAVTNSDEINLLASQFAKKIGVPEVIALIKRKDYVLLAEKNHDIDVIVSPEQATLNRVLTYIRQANIMVCYVLQHHQMQSMEFLVSESCAQVGERVQDIFLPEGSYMICIIRGGNLFAACQNFRIKVHDHIIMIAESTAVAKRLQKVF